MYSRKDRRDGITRPVKQVRCSSHVMSAKFATVRRGRMWRVQITEPNGSVRLFGRFTSENRAREWIAAHSWLASPADTSDSEAGK
jgi:hypothetical protein